LYLMMLMNYIGENRKKLLLTLGFTGATASMLFMFVFPGIYLIGALLVIIGVTCLGCSFVLLNSFLPLLVANHPSIRDPDGGLDGGVDVPMVPMSTENDDADSLDGDEMNGHTGNHTVSDDIPLKKNPFQLGETSPALKLSNQISSKGVGIGYAAALFVQIVGIGIIVLFSKLSPATFVFVVTR